MRWYVLIWCNTMRWNTIWYVTWCDTKWYITNQLCQFINEFDLQGVLNRCSHRLRIQLHISHLPYILSLFEFIFQCPPNFDHPSSYALYWPGDVAIAPTSGGDGCEPEPFWHLKFSARPRPQMPVRLLTKTELELKTSPTIVNNLFFCLLTVAITVEYSHDICQPNIPESYGWFQTAWFTFNDNFWKKKGGQGSGWECSAAYFYTGSKMLYAHGLCPELVSSLSGLTLTLVYFP